MGKRPAHDALARVRSSPASIGAEARDEPRFAAWRLADAPPTAKMAAADDASRPMITSTTTEYLSRLFDAHGLAHVTEGDWIAPDGELPAMRAIWHPGDATGRLDVHVVLPDKTIIEENFAGIGEAEDGLNDGMANFTRNSFHVFLSALWGRTDEEQVTMENWSMGDRAYMAHIGNFGTRGSAGMQPPIPEGLFARLETAIRTGPLTAPTHWFRFFFCNLNGDFTVEALRDNEPWDAGEHALRSAGWSAQDGYYSVRLFLMLRAV